MWCMYGIIENTLFKGDYGWVEQAFVRESHSRLIIIFSLTLYFDWSIRPVSKHRSSHASNLMQISSNKAKDFAHLH